MRCANCEAKPYSAGYVKKAYSGDERRVLRNMRIRRARKNDSTRIAELSTQLGYPATGQEIVQRMERMRPSALHAVFVAESEKLGTGWLHVSVTPLLEVPFRAEGKGLVVDETERRAGSGGQRRRVEGACQCARMCSASGRTNFICAMGTNITKRRRRFGNICK